MTQTFFDLQGVRFARPGGAAVLDGVDFTLAAGERVALLGANGSGKTTLLHVMVGLLTPQAGQVWAFGAPRRTEADFHAVRAQAGLLFQESDDQLFCPTVAEDVAFGPLNLGQSRAQARASAEAALALVGLQGFGPRITHHLSGGQKRLVALASVLAMEPRVLLLDEPTTGLDRDARARLLEVLERLPQAMVLVAHDDEAVERLSTRRVTLCDARLF